LRLIASKPIRERSRPGEQEQHFTPVHRTASHEEKSLSWHANGPLAMSPAGSQDSHFQLERSSAADCANSQFLNSSDPYAASHEFWFEPRTPCTERQLPPS